MSNDLVENIHHRIREEISLLGLSLAETSRRAGENSPQRLKDVLSGRQKCSADLLARLAALGVDISYVLTGERTNEQERSSAAEQQAAYLNQRMSDPSVASIPMYDVECAAGSGRSFEGEPVLGYFHMDRTVLSELKLPSDSGAWVRARGDSMVGTIDDGDYVFVDFTQRDPSREGVYLILMDGERRIKRMQRVAGGGWLLISDNPRYDKELIAPEQKQFVEVLGRCLVNLGQVL